MISNNEYDGSPKQDRPQPDLNARLPALPSRSPNRRLPRSSANVTISTVSTLDEEAYGEQGHSNTDQVYHGAAESYGYSQDAFESSDAIHLQNYGKNDSSQHPPPADQMRERRESDSSPRPHQRSRRKKKKKEPFFSQKTPWVVYFLTVVQITVFIVEVIRNAVLTGSPIEIHPQFNPMIGPSPFVLINMGARYVPCMRNQDGVQNHNTTVSWPCPNQTDSNPTCTLSQLCGFNGVPNPKVNGSLDAHPQPNQWFRFITPIFLHAGLVHISFNMLLQLLLGPDVERAIGHIRFTLVYFSCGIFGFVMGGNFAPGGLASTGASGSLFGIISLVLLDLLYTWSTRPSPWQDFLFICLDVIISFVLGLLPGLDNFSHIGGFLMGIVLGICLLHSPDTLRKRRITGQAMYNNDVHVGSYDKLAAPGWLDSTDNILPKPTQISTTGTSHPSSRTTTPSTPLHHILLHPHQFFSHRHPLWWIWWLLRLAALAGVLATFMVLLRNFYTYHATPCSWCKYLSCLPVNNWCEIGNLDFQTTNATAPTNAVATKAALARF